MESDKQTPQPDSELDQEVGRMMRNLAKQDPEIDGLKEPTVEEDPDPLPEGDVPDTDSPDN